MARVVLVHGSVGNAALTWGSILPELQSRFDVQLHTRSGYPPGGLIPSIDFDEQADALAAELREGDHLVGHSYGGVVSMLAASRYGGELASLTVSEPPAFGLARGNAAVEAFLEAFHEAPRTPRGYLLYFLPLVNSAIAVPDPLPPELAQGAEAAIRERDPSEAEIPLGMLAEKPFAKLVVSGGHSPAFDAVCDVLESSLHAQRRVASGAGHSLPRAPGYLDALVAFLAEAQESRA